MSDKITETHFCGKVAQKIILIRDKKVLITRDSRDQIWELPGGRLNEGENPQTGVLREVEEELGVDVAVERVVYINQFLHSNNKPALVIIYQARLVDESAVFSPDPLEVAQMEWVDALDWHTYSYYPEYTAALKEYFSAT